MRARWQTLAAQVAAAGGSADWRLLGLSLGGMVAVDWVARHPTDFRALVVVNSTARNAGFVWDRLQASKDQRLAPPERTLRCPRVRRRACQACRAAGGGRSPAPWPRGWLPSWHP